MATNTHSHSRPGAFSRRKMLVGMSAGLAATAIPLKAYSFPAGLSGQGQVLSGAMRKPRGETTLAKYLCSQSHGKIAANLDGIIADPAIDGEQTSLALMQARCPGCGERVEPATSRISAVIPQWKTHINGPQKFGVTA